jgi:hypothetical protein
MANPLLQKVTVEDRRAPFRCFFAALVVFSLGTSLAIAQATTPQTAPLCVQKPFQEITHGDITVPPDVSSAHAVFSVRLPNTPSKIQQIDVRVGPPISNAGFLLMNLTATIRLNNILIEHGVDVPNNPFLQSMSFAATMSRQVTFYADAGSVAVFQADFIARPQDIAGVDISIVGLTRSEGCAIIQ